MKTRLVLRLSSSDASPERAETWAELQREIDLPFAPHAGMRLHLRVIDSAHPNAGRFQKALKSSIFVTGVFEVETVTYNIEEQTLNVTAYEGYQTAQEVQEAVNQYVLGYGFRDDTALSDEDE